MAQPKDSTRRLANFLFGTPEEADTKPYCAFNCDNPSHDWKDELCKAEFKISGICQNCQDEIFTQPEERDCPHFDMGTSPYEPRD